jgi:glycyl-tRNA synthetase beta chain
MARGEYLLEVRAEEIPARMLPGAIKELASRVFEELMARGLGPAEVETGFTPRRLVVILKGLPEGENDRDEQAYGPPVQAAFDASGEPTAAAVGFAKRFQVGVEDLRIVEGKPGQRFKSETPLAGLTASDIGGIRAQKGRYLAHVQRIAGRRVDAVLAELVPQILRGISWAKTMRWGTSEQLGPWVRPVHGILSLLDGEIVRFDLFGVSASLESSGHPILSPESFQVADAGQYRSELAARGIEVSAQARRRRLCEAMSAAAEAAGGKLVEDAELLDKLAAICEIPGVMEGGFAEDYLALPREILQTSLRDHQSALTAERDGRLLAKFFTVMDRADDPQGRVRAGNEWVVAARLADARFFYGEDRKTPLAERAARLDHLGFHEKLGSYADKTKRVEALAGAICDELGWSEARADALAAARWLKADLLTDVVKEFTSLQGIMGGIYAREEGAPDGVWQAIYDQYLPATTSDRLPRGRVGLVVGLADRLDTLAGIFGLALVPSGSKDPFGLRRAAQAVVRIVLEGKLACDLERLVPAAVTAYGSRVKRGQDEVLNDLRPFLYDRLRYVLGLQGFAYDEIEAGLGAGGLDLGDLRARVAALHTAREAPAFRSIVLAAKRIANILREVPSQTLDPGRLAHPTERALHAALAEMRAEVEEAAARREYQRALGRIEGLAETLDRFFVDVLVMDPDPAVRANRLALLQEIGAVLGRVARHTDMVVERQA